MHSAEHMNYEFFSNVMVITIITGGRKGKGYLVLLLPERAACKKKRLVNKDS